MEKGKFTDEELMQAILEDDPEGRRWNNGRNNLKNPDYCAVVKAGWAANLVDNVDSYSVDFNELEPTTCSYTFRFMPKCTKKQCMSSLDTIVKELRKYKPFDADGTLYMSGVSWYFAKYQRYWECAFRIKNEQFKA